MKKITLLLVTGALLAFSCKKPLSEDIASDIVSHDNMKVSLLSGTVASNDSAFNILTYAGTGTAGDNNGSTGNPLTAEFDAPEGIVFDSNGNMFVADRDNHVIRKITPGGTVSIFAGVLNSPGAQNGALGVAHFNLPIRLAIDGADNIYVADRDNARIRMVTPAGVVSTIAGSIAGSNTNQFDWPIDVAVNSAGTKVYVADSRNHRIQQITLSGGNWATSLLAGSTTPEYQNGTGNAARFRYPSGVALDNSGNIIVADRLNNCIRKVTPSGAVSLLAGVPELTTKYSLDATKLKAKMGEPYGVTVANDGCIYITDIYFHTIRRLNSEGFLATVGGSGASGAVDGNFSSFNIPTSIAIDNSGNFYVADVGNNKIRKMVPELRTLQYTQGWGKSTSANYPGVTWYYFHGSRFFLPSANINKTQYVNVLDIDLSVNHLDFVHVDTLQKNRVSSLIGSSSTAIAALSGTFSSYQKSGEVHGGYLRNNNVTYWNSLVVNTSYLWIYHEGMFFINSDGTTGMELSNMTQNPFSPTLRKYMMSGAPLLINNNAIFETASRPQGIWTDYNYKIRTQIAARSIIGIPTTNNHLILICIDGIEPDATTICAPAPIGYGMTTADAAQFVKRYFNAKAALNLDGGGSASMCLKGEGDNGGVSGGLGVISYPAWAPAPCPSAHTQYANQRNTMQNAIAVLPN